MKPILHFFVLGVIALAIALYTLVARPRLRAEIGRGLVYAMGTLAAYWSVDCILAVFAG